MVERPLGITIISILGFLGGILALIIEMILLIATTNPLGVWGTLLEIVIIVGAVVQFVVSFGLWIMKKWAFYIEIILLSISLVTEIASTVFGSIISIGGVVIAAIIIYYLYTKRKLFS